MYFFSGLKFYCLVGFPQFAFFFAFIFFFFHPNIIFRWDPGIIYQSGPTVASGMAIKTVCLLLKMEDLYFWAGPRPQRAAYLFRLEAAMWLREIRSRTWYLATTRSSPFKGLSAIKGHCRPCKDRPSTVHPFIWTRIRPLYQKVVVFIGIYKNLQASS